MKLSFIIPCYNGANTLHYSVDSVVQQGIEDYEIIIVNDGSEDNTLKVAYEIAKVNRNVVVLDKPNGGVSSARNYGIKKATGDYLVFLDADDEFAPEFWREVKPYVNPINSTIIFGFDYEESPTEVRVYKNKYNHDLVSDYLMGRVHIHICSFITKRDLVFDNNIFFDEGTYFSEDREFIVKVLLASSHYKYINKVFFHYKYRDGSAMHIPIYTSRKSTSLDAMERVLNIVEGDRIKREAALIQLKLTIILHVKSYIKTNCKDYTLWLKLRAYSTKYLKINTSLSFNKYAIYVWILGGLYNLNEKLFIKVLTCLSNGKRINDRSVRK